MRCLIISDVHANEPALEAVLAAPAARRCDALVCLGDLVGYYTWPNECVARIRERASVCIAGNHDLAAIDRLDSSDFGRAARLAIAWTRAQLSRESRAYLEHLPIWASFEHGFACVHGALHPQPNSTLHLSSPARIAKSLEALRAGVVGANVCFFGHTHHPAVLVHDGTSVHALDELELELDERYHYLINPGSVGQSRDRDPRASFVVFDARSRRLSFHRAEYDREAVLDSARRAGLLDEPKIRERAADFVAARFGSGKSWLARAWYAARRLGSG